MKAQRLGTAEWSLLGYARLAVFLKTERRPLPWVSFLASFDMSMWPSLVWGASEKEFAKIIELTVFVVFFCQDRFTCDPTATGLQNSIEAP